MQRQALNAISAIAAAAALATLTLAAAAARADAVTDWNVKAGEWIGEARIGTPPAVRIMAITHSAVYEAANAITRRSPASASFDVAPGASIDAAIAAANRATLTKLLPSQQTLIDGYYQTVIAKVTNEAARTAGIAAGEKAAAAVMAARTDDGARAASADAYRPQTTAGAYVPTAPTAASQWPRRVPWLMTSAAQFRPGPPPALTSDVWTRDFNEIKTLGGKTSAQRSAEQTEIARFWDYSLPPIYHGIVRSVADQPGRDATRNARLFAAVTQAMDDALIAIFDAKYHYNFWRPVTAIRNADIDGNDATERDPSWAPFIDTPMHPEYPCAHCVIANAASTVLDAEIGAGPGPTLSTKSPTANGATRSWATPAAFAQEVAEARILDGVHYRNSTVVGSAMGKQVGALAVARYLRRAD